MSEMLGNQYFIARRYADAGQELESELHKNPVNYSIKKKLIICYLQTHQFEKAFKYFFDIVTHDISIISNTDLERDDCPCPGIIEQTLPELKFTSEEDHFIKLGMLYLYCDMDDSINYFEKVTANHQLFEQVKEILSIEKSQKTKIN